MRFISFFLFIIFSVTGIQAQTKTIKGTVLDGDFNNEPLPGATISVPSAAGKAATGTTSDFDGHFTLKVADSDTHIKVRFLGYQTKRVPLKQNVQNYTIILKSASKEMNELVVTGYQKIDRRKLTSAVTTINISDEKIGAVKSIDQALAGQISGLSSVASSGAPVLLLKSASEVLLLSTEHKSRFGYWTACPWKERKSQIWRI